MPHYLLTVVEPSTGPGLAPGRLQEIQADVETVHREMADVGVWVFGGGLHPTTTATTLRPGEGGLLVTDGPLIEGPEHVGGFSIIDVPGLDSALAWGRTLVGASTIPIEVRPFYDGAG